MRLLGILLVYAVGLIAGLVIGHVVPYWVVWPDGVLGFVAGCIVTFRKD